MDTRLCVFFALSCRAVFVIADTCTSGVGDCSTDSFALLQKSIDQRKVHSMILASSQERNRTGAKWTEQEALDVMAKLVNLASSSLGTKDMHSGLECYLPGAEDGTMVPCSYVDNRWKHRGVSPSLPMMLRFGFHQCIPYADGTGGCNGRLNLKGSFFRFEDNRGRFSCTDGNGKRKGDGRCYAPEGSSKRLASHNGNLALLGDALEMVFTDPSFPVKSPVLGVSDQYPQGKSLKDSGKSRADLWAFAALVAGHLGFQQSNKACDEGVSLYSQDVWPVQPCKTDVRSLRFWTGRTDSEESEPVSKCAARCVKNSGKGTFMRKGCKDGFHPCKLDKMCKLAKCRDCDMCLPVVDGGHRARAYDTEKEEKAPATWFNGSMVADYFADNFGFTKRETVAVMGAHSFGKVHGEVSGGFRYDWTHHTTDQLNNAYYRVIGLLDGKNFERKGRWEVDSKPVAIGGVNGALAKTYVSLHVDGKETGGGHFQWFHDYERCPFCTEDGRLIDRHLSAWGLQRFNRTKIHTPRGKNRDGSQKYVTVEARAAVRPEPCCELCKKASKAVARGEDPTIGSSGEPKPRFGDHHRRRFLFRTEGLSDVDKVAGTDLTEKEYFEEGQCIRNSSVHETMFTSDFGLSHKVMVEVPGGMPLNCRNLQNGWGDCPKNDLVDEGSGMTMYEIVEQYANDPKKWEADFVSVLEKMLTNGMTDKQKANMEDSLDFSKASCSSSRGEWVCVKK